MHTTHSHMHMRRTDTYQQALNLKLEASGRPQNCCVWNVAIFLPQRKPHLGGGSHLALRLAEQLGFDQTFCHESMWMTQWVNIIIIHFCVCL